MILVFYVHLSMSESEFVWKDSRSVMDATGIINLMQAAMKDEDHDDRQEAPNQNRMGFRTD